MYPRNAASPERIAIGPVVQISDGAVQTSGVAVKVIPFGSTEASGTGTVAYSADGVVLYTPVQGETNYTSFVLIASKTGCIPATQTIVTTAESTVGTVSANVTKVAGVSAAIGTATVSTSSTTTSVTTSACSPAGAAADQFKGRVIIFGNSTTTTALRGCAALITASSNSATPTFTLAAALPTSPVSGDTFVIA